MASIGTYLQELRTRRGVSLEEVARTTRVAPRYLLALENDAFSDLPAPVFIRGFIRAYCQALGESPQEALTIYDGHDGRPRQPPLRAPTPTRARAAEPRTRGALIVSFVLLVVMGMALFTVALVIRPGDRTDRPGVEARPDPRPAPPPPETPSDRAPAIPTPGSSPAPPADSRSSPATVRSTPPTPAVPTPPAPAAQAPPAVTPKPEAIAAPRTAAAPTPPAPAPSLDIAVGPVSSPYRLVARTNDTTWIRVRTEDGHSSEETVPAGEIREWVSDRPFVLTVGNAGGVSFELNGRALPPLGPRGVVIPRLVVPPDAR